MATVWWEEKFLFHRLSLPGSFPILSPILSATKFPVYGTHGPAFSCLYKATLDAGLKTFVNQNVCMSGIGEEWKRWYEP